MNDSDDIFKELAGLEPEDVVKKLCLLYPDLKWEISNKDDTAYVDDEVNNRLVGLVSDEAVIFDLYSSNCGRFIVTPETEYGVPSFVAAAISRYNKFH